MKEERARVTCITCGQVLEKTCTLGYVAEESFYLKYKPKCKRCGGREWAIEEITEKVLK